ncbi:sigma 54-interacting transcriptional regulator [bacterium]|nr:sigma 54-interacting transcriptional regulator [Candidatus Neomarinimicrobiota bacterium]MCK5687437.1 sigma 54-interacting transcriptional regulator [bacterium]
MGTLFESNDYNEGLEELVVEQARKLLNQNSYTKSILSTLPVALVATDKTGKVRSFNKTAKKLLDLSNTTTLLACFPENKSLQKKIESCLNEDESYTLYSQKIRSKEKKENVVNIYLQPLYDDERESCGILLAMEDQTYVSFLKESFLRYTSPHDNSIVIDNIALTKKVLVRIKDASKQEHTTLFVGGSGTGKSFFASKLHLEYGFTPNDPLIVIDCKKIKDKNPGTFIFGNVKTNKSKDGEIAFRSVSDYGAIHLAQNGSLILKNIESLTLEAQEDLLLYINRKETRFLHDINTRIILTTSINISELKEEEFNQDLANYLFDNIISIPSLWKRRKEIIPLAKLFLAESKNGENKKFSSDAENLLLSRHYSYNNVKELKEAVELAAEVSAENEISSECIFIGPKEESSLLEFSISQLSIIKWLISDKVLKNIRLLVLLLFFATSLVSIIYTNTELGSVVNGIIWGIWWPGFIILLLIGRLWCSICPLSTAASIGKKMLALELKPPTWIKNNTYLIIPLGFVIILTIEYIFHMVETPVATGIFLLSLILLATVFSVLYERETWCRYVCPLGGIGAIFTIGGILNVKANPDVCSSLCKTHECNKGSVSQAGCPVFHHPLYAKENHVCKLCFNCLKSCPHNSAKLTLQIPMVKIWRQKELPNTLSVLALSLFFMAPLLLAAKLFSELTTSITFILSASCAFGLAYFTSRILSRFDRNIIDESILKPSRISFALLILSWGVFAAFQFSNIPVLNSLEIHSPEGTVWNAIFSSTGVSLIKILQSVTIIFAAVFGWITVLSIKKQLINEAKNIVPIMSIIFILYIVLNMFMILKI